jgi:hypothetical protein
MTSGRIWICLVQDRDKWRALLNALMNLPILLKGKKEPFASQGRFCSTESNSSCNIRIINGLKFGANVNSPNIQYIPQTRYFIDFSSRYIADKTCGWSHTNSQLHAHFLHTYFIQQSPPWESNRFADSQKIPRILWNPKFHYRIHKCPPPVPILSQLDPVHTPTSYFLLIRLNIILLSTPGSPKWPISFRFPHHNPEYASPILLTRYMPRPSHSRFYHPNNIGCAVQIIKLLIM